ncbi:MULTISPECIES: hypothetical protein [Pantoea]|jgi:hypothetical protein|uniref:Restriction endonuclease type IV Mrr domain-containing protein n=1 Tax=Pantoea brenneri TaxID=472694 RepID=A0A653ZIY3_9GAMM|nr:MULTISPECIES: hypothetical protein [Pantoea]KKD30989.1 hypothetical protein EP46_17700 [Pantoea sp. 3.5.1]MBS6035612.1 hypothetical protein [Pantoea sp.]MBZ6397386.1 hypothetical protein [Pantoea sp.]MBZ6440605.1 hypothetical protein [Pantoea sp.]MCQ5471589.1 hypothetical protein [Pantoea brenneri]
MNSSDQTVISATSFTQAATLLEQGSRARIRLSWNISGDEFFRLVNLVKQGSEMSIEKEEDGFWLTQK